MNAWSEGEQLGVVDLAKVHMLHSGPRLIGLATQRMGHQMCERQIISR